MTSKWVQVDDVKAQASKVATEILRQRVDYVEQMLPLAAYEYQADVEHVHQLRVGCRRAGAAWQAFRPLMDDKGNKLRKWLRAIRRSAGPARDVDVLLTRLKKETGPGQKYVVARLKQQRADAQQALVNIAEQVDAGKLQRSLDRCLLAFAQRSGKRSHKSFRKFARQALREASRKMFRLAGVRKPTVEQLHEFRIAGKRLRYSIELFHNAFSDELREEVYPLVENIQSRLGGLNDYATAQTLYQRWLAKLPADRRAAQVAARIVKEHEAIVEVREDFLQWWTPKRVAKLESSLSALIDSAR